MNKDIKDFDCDPDTTHPNMYLTYSDALGEIPDEEIIDIAKNIIKIRNSV